MSLVSNAMETFTKLIQVRTNDTEGGYTTTWTKARTFKGALTTSSSVKEKISESQRSVDTYTLTVQKETFLQFGTVFQRKNGETFKVVSNDGDQRRTPDTAGIDMRQYTVERWELPK